MKEKLIQDCPNCSGEYPENCVDIKPNNDGSCGVCSDTHLIEWERVGKLIEINKK